MNKTLWLMLTMVSLFIVSVVLIIMRPQTEAEKVSQLCWSNKDPLMITLQRYNKAYHSLTDENEKREIARLYLLAISKTVLVLPPNKDIEKLQVILPVTEGDKEIVVLRDIQLGADNGLYAAFQQRNRKRSRYSEPPGPPSKIEKLVNRVISGCGEA